MALDQSALLELTEALRSADGGDLMRRLLLTILQAVIDAEATAQIGAAPHERTATRTTQRNGSRPKTVTTAVGDLTVAIPETRRERLPAEVARRGCSPAAPATSAPMSVWPFAPRAGTWSPSTI